MEETIDRLILDIQVLENSTVKKLDAITSSIDRLHNSAQKVSGAVQGATSSIEKVGGEATANVEHQIGKINDTLGETAEKIGDVAEKSEEVQEKVVDSTDKATKSTNKLFASIKRIAMYRIIRAAFSWITNAFKEGVKNLLEYEKGLKEIEKIGANKTISNITSAMTSFKNSLGVMSIYLLQILEPIIVWVLNALTSVANGIGKVLAYLKGEKTYLQANTKYWEEFNKSVKKATYSLAAFDEINQITSGGSDAANQLNYNDMFKQEKFSEAALKIQDTLRVIAAVTGAAAVGLGIALMVMGHFGIGLGLILAGGILVAQAINWDEFPNKVKEMLKNVKEAFKNTWEEVFGEGSFKYAEDFGSDLKELFKGVAQFIKGIFTLSGEDILAGFVNVLVAVINLIADVGDFVVYLINQLLEAIGLGKDVIPYASQLNCVTAAGKVVVNSVTADNEYMTGGFPEDGFFYANHNELVGGFSNGRTAVANNTQIIEGIRLGVYDGVYDAMTRTQGSGKQAIIINGREVFTVVRDENDSFKRRTGQSAF